ncbi:MAG: flagellar hook-associated protein FlgK [Lachnospiraceae bacterium]|nr:flagellar hook-associated protein FlgK [Lachnospiraceae bacterium]
MSTFGGLYVGSSGIKANQNSLNTTAHNLANINTKGYTRQQVYQADLAPNDVGASSISMMQAGLGVSYSEARQIRDVFLDKFYRLESGRDKFYDTAYTGIRELELFFGELEGVAFQDSTLQLYQSLEEWDKIPDDSNNLDLVILRSYEFLQRAQSVYDGVKDYQRDINDKISSEVDAINDIGRNIVKLNKDIMRIEAAGIEKADDLRDERNALLDDLAEYINVDYEELHDGVVLVKVEGEYFVGRSTYNEMSTYYDKATGFLTPVWAHLAKEGEPAYEHPVFDFSHGISSANNSDIGSLKSMVLIRGTSQANYHDLEGLTAEEYTEGIQMRTMMNAEAEFDQFIHNVVTQINDLLSPTIEVKDETGKTYRVWDENGPYSASGSVPGEEMFIRNGLPRYTEKVLTVNGERKTYYVYNEEDTTNPETMYTLDSLNINPKLLEDESELPHLTRNGSVNYELTSAMVELFQNRSMTLNPTDTTQLTILEYYQNMINMFASEGETYKSKEQTVAGTVESIGNKRQQVLGVSSDEELSNMIKFQNAFNASSRYINVVNEMIEHIIMRL